MPVDHTPAQKLVGRMLNALVVLVRHGRLLPMNPSRARLGALPAIGALKFFKRSRVVVPILHAFADRGFVELWRRHVEQAASTQSHTILRAERVAVGAHDQLVCWAIIGLAELPQLAISTACRAFANGDASSGLKALVVFVRGAHLAAPWVVMPLGAQRLASNAAICCDVYDGYLMAVSSPCSRWRQHL